MLRLLVAAAALLAVLLAVLAGCHGPSARRHGAQSARTGTASGVAAGASVADLVITAAATPSARRLFPGTRGDAVLSMRNPNPFPVTVTGVWLPAATTFAQGFADAALHRARSGCAAANSLVAWADTRAGASEHVLSAPLVLGVAGSPDATVLVTVRDAVSMGADAPSACASAYFKMPSLAGVDAYAGGVPSGGPRTVRWNARSDGET